ncbi:thioredoxin domain-containing protein [Candidatus Uhrbacteria bacterium]|nr:thioredoxin domain-containing protein [Candidatus Uhrbacteria bacterium]
MPSPIVPLSDAHLHKQRNWFATIITLAVILLLGAFVWRVLTLAQQIRSGAVDPSTFDFKQSFTSSLRLSAIPLTTGNVNLVTTDDPSLGRADAPLTVVEFADFGCPFSREAGFTLRELSLRYPEKFRYIYRDFPIGELHPIAQKAAEAAECASEQGRFWEYHDKLFHNQSDLSQERLYEFATELNLNTQTFRECLDSGRKREEVLQDYQDGIDAGVRGTPTFFFNGKKVEGAIPKKTFEALINAVP